MTLLELGQIIREKREEQNITIDEIAAQIKVSARILKAIEDGSREGLPHAVYTKGFIRSFAAAVKVDQEDLDRALEVIFPPEAFDDAKPDSGAMVRSFPSTGVAQRIAAIVILLLLFVGLVAGGWYVATTYGDDIVELVKKPFSAVTPRPEPSALRVVALSSFPLQDIEPEKGEDTASTTVAQQVEGLVPSVQAAAPEFMRAAAWTEGAEAVKTSFPSRQEDPGYKVVIAAKEECYLDVLADSEKAKRFILKSNETYPIAFQSSLRLIVGNAGGIAISYNGQDLGEIGPKNKRKELTFPF